MVQLGDGTQKLKEVKMSDKICPILMAGTMISNIDVIEVMKGHHLYYESVRCMGEKCEWFENGCPAHPHAEYPKLALRRNELLVKLRANQISRSEAIELNDILVEEQRVAQERGDTSALVVIGLGLALLASKLGTSKPLPPK